MVGAARRKKEKKGKFITFATCLVVNCQLGSVGFFYSRASAVKSVIRETKGKEQTQNCRNVIPDQQLLISLEGF